MMIHRKSEHKNFVKSCSQFNLGNCMFRDETCWFAHDVEAVDETNDNVEDETDKSEQVFQKVKEKTKPPLQSQKEQKKISRNFSLLK